MEKHAHTVRSYEEELRSLTRQVAEMLEASETQLTRALNALAQKDSVLAKVVIGRDKKVNAIQSAVDALTVRMLAKRQPMAYDLRIIVSSQRMAADLERIADYAANIAKNVVELNTLDGDLPTAEIQAMGDCALDMLHRLKSAYLENDLKGAMAAWESDQRINTLFTELIVRLRELMRRDPANVQGGTILLFAGRCCERIGDHLKNVAEQIAYMQTGESLPCRPSPTDCA
jgi:phosphate transport system protein